MEDDKDELTPLASPEASASQEPEHKVQSAELIASGKVNPDTGELELDFAQGGESNPVLAKLANLIKESIKENHKPEAMEPDEVINLFIGATWEPEIGDVVVLRPEFDCTQPVLLKDTEYVITQLIDPPLHHGDPGDSAWGKPHDCAVAVKIGHGHHYHYHEVLCDSRNLKKTGSIMELMSNYVAEKAPFEFGEALSTVLNHIASEQNKNPGSGG
jgi:hypothetical protein